MDAIFIDNSSFSVSGDYSTTFYSGRRIKANCGVDGYIYGTIASGVYNSTDTIVYIDESTLTSNITSVTVGVVGAGAIGSLPEHFHTSSAGDGGEITISDTTPSFLDLTDTPNSYDTGKFLRSTASGIDYQAVVLYGTGDPPSATGLPDGTLYVKYSV